MSEAFALMLSANLWFLAVQSMVSHGAKLGRPICYGYAGAALALLLQSFAPIASLEFLEIAFRASLIIALSSVSYMLWKTGERK